MTRRFGNSRCLLSHPTISITWTFIAVPFCLFSVCCVFLMWCLSNKHCMCSSINQFICLLNVNAVNKCYNFVTYQFIFSHVLYFWFCFICCYFVWFLELQFLSGSELKAFFILLFWFSSELLLLLFPRIWLINCCHIKISSFHVYKMLYTWKKLIFIRGQFITKQK